MIDRAGPGPKRSGAPASLAPEPMRLSAATIMRATAFLGAGRIEAPAATVLANSLRELDRFLSLLLDDVAASALPAGYDRAAFARQSNTPNKLARVHDALGVASPDQARLRAIGRSRERLFHAARAARAATHLPGEQHLAEDLRGICRLYGRIADELVIACQARAPLH